LLGLPCSRVSVQLHPGIFIYYIQGQIILLAQKMLAGSSDMFLGPTPAFWFQNSGKPSGSPDMMFSRDEKHTHAGKKDIVNKQAST
jgi:hypothetical protein